MPPKYIRNEGKRWSPQEVRTLKSLAKGNTPTRVIGLKLGRPVGGVKAMASKTKASLMPPNRSPYGTKK